MSEQQPRQGAISLRTALALYVLLFAGAAVSLRGKYRIVMLLIIALLAAKALLVHLRGRIRD